MPDQLYTFTFKEVSWFVGGCGAVITAITVAVWHLMIRQADHWKQAYEAKSAELAESRKETEQIKTHPEAFAMVLISQADSVMTSQIDKLRQNVAALRAECAAKDGEIRRLTAAAHASEEQLVYAEEAKEKLERQLKVYDEILDRLLARRDRARETLSSFRSGDFDVDELENIVDSEIKKKMIDINASSFSRYSKITRAAAQQASRAYEMRTSREMKAKLEGIQGAEEGTHMHASLPVPQSKPDG